MAKILKKTMMKINELFRQTLLIGFFPVLFSTGRLEELKKMATQLGFFDDVVLDEKGTYQKTFLW